MSLAHFIALCGLSGFVAGLILRLPVALAVPSAVGAIAALVQLAVGPPERFGIPGWITAALGLVIGASGIPFVLAAYAIHSRRAA